MKIYREKSAFQWFTPLLSQRLVLCSEPCSDIAQFIYVELNWRWNSQECTQQPYGMPVYATAPTPQH